MEHSPNGKKNGIVPPRHPPTMNGTDVNKNAGVISKKMPDSIRFAVDPDKNSKHLEDEKILKEAINLSVEVFLKHYSNELKDIQQCKSYISLWKITDQQEQQTVSSADETNSKDTILIDIERNGVVNSKSIKEREDTIKEVASRILSAYIEARKSSSNHFQEKDDNDTNHIERGAWWFHRNVISPLTTYVENMIHNPTLNGSSPNVIELDGETEVIEENKMKIWIRSTYLATPHNTTQTHVTKIKNFIDKLTETDIVETCIPIIFTIVAKDFNGENNNMTVPVESIIKPIKKTDEDMWKNISTFDSDDDISFTMGAHTSNKIPMGGIPKNMENNNNTTSTLAEAHRLSNNIPIDTRPRDKRLKFYVDMQKYGVLIPVCIWEEIYKTYAYYTGVRIMMIAENYNIAADESKGNSDEAIYTRLAEQFRGIAQGWFDTALRTNSYGDLYDTHSDYEDEEYEESDTEEYEPEDIIELENVNIVKDSVTSKNDIAPSDQKSVQFADSSNSDVENNAMKNAIGTKNNLKKRSSATSNNKKTAAISPGLNSHKRRHYFNMNGVNKLSPGQNSTSDSSNSTDNKLKSLVDPPEVQEILRTHYSTDIERFIADKAIEFFREFYSKRSAINIANNISRDSGMGGGSGIQDIDVRSYVLLTMRHLPPYKAMPLLTMSSTELNKTFINNTQIGIKLESTASNNNNKNHHLHQEEPPVGNEKSYVLEKNSELFSSLSSILFYALKIYGILDIDCNRITDETDAYKLLNNENVRNNIKELNSDSVKRLKKTPAAVALAMRSLPDIYLKKQTIPVYGGSDDDKYFTTFVNDVSPDYWINIVYNDDTQTLNIRDDSSRNILSEDSNFLLMTGEWQRISMILDNAGAYRSFKDK